MADIKMFDIVKSHHLRLWKLVATALSPACNPQLQF